MKFGQKLVRLTTNISHMFLAQYWRLETSSGLFIILMKWQYNKICHFLVVDIYHFLLLPSLPFQKNETLETYHN